MKIRYEYKLGDEKIIAIYRAPNLIDLGYEEHTIQIPQNDLDKMMLQVKPLSEFLKG